LAKKPSVAKAKKGGRARSKRAASAEVKQEQDRSLVEATPAAEKKPHPLLRLLKPKAQAKVEDKGTAELAEVKKRTKRTPRTRESGKPKKVPFQGTVRFFQSAWGELRKVHWPGRREIAVYTTVVITAVILVAVMIWIADTALSALINVLLNL